MSKGNTKKQNKNQPIPIGYNTPVSAFTDKYGVSFNMPADTKLGDYFKQAGVPSAAKFLKLISG